MNEDTLAGARMGNVEIVDKAARIVDYVAERYTGDRGQACALVAGLLAGGHIDLEDD